MIVLCIYVLSVTCHVNKDIVIVIVISTQIAVPNMLVNDCNKGREDGD